MRSESSPPSISRFAAVVAGVLALSAGVIAAGMWPNNAEWAPAWAGLTMLYGMGAVALWQGRDWARAFMLGVAGWGLCGWIEACFALGLGSLTIGATLGHALLVGLAAFVPARLSRRHAWALFLASAALPCGVAFGLAPEQSLGLASAMLGGTALLVCGAVGLARGRTWGLLLGLAGAPLIALAAAHAPVIAWLHAPHPMLPANGLLLSFVGMCAAGLAFASFIPFAGPVVRFLRR